MIQTPRVIFSLMLLVGLFSFGNRVSAQYDQVAVQPSPGDSCSGWGMSCQWQVNNDATPCSPGTSYPACPAASASCDQYFTSSGQCGSCDFVGGAVGYANDVMLCNSNSNGNGSTGGTSSTPSFSYTCNAAGTQASLAFSGGGSTTYALRIDADPNSWTGSCPGGWFTPGPGMSQDFCGNVFSSQSPFRVNTVPGANYTAWIHPSFPVCGLFGCDGSATLGAASSLSFNCPPPPPPAPTVTFWADPSNVPYNGTSVLKWTSTNATSCTALVSAPYTNWNSGGAPNNASGISTGPLTVNQTYGLRCTGAGGPLIDAFATVTVGAPPVTPPDPTGLTATCLTPNQVRLSWNPSVGATGYAFRADYATPSWDGTCTSPDECSGIAASSYDKAVTPGITYDWWVHACNSAGCSPGIHGPNFRCDYPATVDLKVNGGDSLTIQNNSPVTLTWSTSNVIAGSCSASGEWSGAKADNNASGESRGNLSTGTHTFVLTCREQGTNAPISDTVQVTSIDPPCTPNGCEANTCIPKTCNNGCGVSVPGTKDCREHWQEVAP